MRNIYFILFSFFLLCDFFVLGQTQKQYDSITDLALKKMFQKDHNQSLEILVKVKSVAEAKKWDQQLFRAVNNIGANYYLMMDYDEALKHYMEAYEIAKKMDDKKNVMTVLNNIAILYFQEKNNKKAYEYFYKAYLQSRENNLPNKTAAYAVNLGLVLNKLNQLNEAEKYINEVDNSDKIDSNVQLMNQMAWAENLMLRKEYEASLKIIKAIYPKLQTIDQNENKLFILLVLAQIYQAQENLDEAENQVKEARKIAHNIRERAEIYQILSEIQAKKRNYDLSLIYKDSVILVNDSIAKIQNSNFFNNEKIKFEIQNYQFELKDSQEKLKQERKIIYIISIATCIILVLIFYLFRNYQIKFKQKEKIDKLEIEKKNAHNLLLEKQLEEQETRSLLEKERLKNEVEVQNRQLSSRALHLASRNEIIEEIIENISQQTVIAKNIELKKYILDLKNQLKNDHQWESFFTHFEGVNKGFLDRLKIAHPELIPSEIRFLVYVYMNLSNKEIASLLNITPHSCRKRKERLTKKMNIPDEMSLFNYISTI